MTESETDNTSMVAVDNDNGRADAQEERAQQREEASTSSTEPRTNMRTRIHSRLISISSLAIPLLVVTFLLFPAVIVIALLVGICIIPACVVICFGFIVYFFAPETSSTFALVWGSGGASQRAWDMDWTLSGYIESLESRSRADLEKLLIVKTVVEAEDESDVEKDEKAGAESNKQSDQDKGPPASQDIQQERIESDGHEGAEKMEQDIETGDLAKKSSKKSLRSKPSLGFDHSSMIRANCIPKPCCDICMMDYEVDDKISESKNPECDHIFHKECILDWMQKKHSCPCCRRNYLGEEEHDNIATPGWRDNL